MFTADRFEVIDQFAVGSLGEKTRERPSAILGPTSANFH